MKNKENKAMTRPLLAVIAAVLFAVPIFAYTPPAAAELEAAASSFLLRDGVVVDPAREALYVMQDQGVAAFSTLGERLWKSGEAARPVGLYGDQLVALAAPQGIGTVEVVLLNVRDGAKVSAISANLSSDAGGWIVDRPHQRFDARTELIGGQLVLSWDFTSRPLRGAAVVAAGEPALIETTLSGQLQLDPANGSAVDRIDDRPRSAFRLDLAAEERLANFQGRQFRAGDDRHVLASEKRDNSDGWNRYRWTLADRNGNRLGEVDRPVSVAPFFVSGTTLVHEAGPSLRRLPSGEFEAKGLRLVAVDLQRGGEQWSIEVRDTVYRGVMPP